MGRADSWPTANLLLLDRGHAPLRLRPLVGVVWSASATPTWGRSWGVVLWRGPAPLTIASRLHCRPWMGGATIWHTEVRGLTYNQNNIHCLWGVANSFNLGFHWISRDFTGFHWISLDFKCGSVKFVSGFL